MLGAHRGPAELALRIPVHVGPTGYVVHDTHPYSKLICDEWLWCSIATPGAIPKHLRNLRAALTTLILPPRRPKRSYPRAVKIKMSNYARKRCEGSK